MKSMKFCLTIIMLIAIFNQITSAKPDMKEKLANIQIILNTSSPHCIEYRDAVNDYLRAFLPEKKCQLQCHNRDDEYAGQFTNWYIPNNLRVVPKNCGQVADDCNYKFDEPWMFGNVFYELMLDAQVFIDVVMRKGYLSFCL